MSLLTSIAAGVAGASGFPWGPGGSVRVDKVVDFVLNPMGAADVLPVINVPAGSFVRVAVECLAVSTAGTFIDVGDGADPDGYIDNASITALAKVGFQPVVSTTITGYSCGKYYPTADTIDLIAVAATVTGKVRVSALIQNINC